MEVIRLILIGIVLGVANVIPGVSGGTMAVVFNIYDKLLNVITINIKKILAQWKFVLPLGIGMVVGIVGFSKIITCLFENYPVPTNFFFMGIILGSFPMICKRIKLKNKNIEKDENSLSLFTAISMVVLGGLLVTAFMFMQADSQSDDIVTQVNIIFGCKLFIGAALAAIAMIIPGISGSFLMLVLGVYHSIIAAISQFNIPILAIVACGVLLGLLGGASLVRFLITKVPSQTYAFILGLVLASLVTIFPLEGFKVVLNQGIGYFCFICGLALLCLCAGFALSYCFDKFSKQENTADKKVENNA